MSRAGPLCLVVLPLLAGAADARRVQVESLKNVPVISTGAVTGPFAVAEDADGVLHIVYQSRESDETPQELRYRHEEGGGVWSDPETVHQGAISGASIGIGPWGPVVAMTTPDGALLSRRVAGAWRDTALLGRGEKPGPVAVQANPGEASVLFVVEAGDGLLLRRVTVVEGGTKTPDDAPFPERAAGDIDRMRAVLGPSGSQHMAILRRAPISRVRVIGADGETEAGSIVTLAYLSLGSGVRLFTALPTRGKLERFDVLEVAGSPAMVWTQSQAGSTQVLFRMMRGGRQTAVPEQIHDGPDEQLHAIAAAGNATHAVVALVTGEPPRREVRTSWLNGSFWSGWATPPGWDGLLHGDPTELRVVLGASGRARMVVQERTAGGDRLVLWEALPSGLLQIHP